MKLYSKIYFTIFLIAAFAASSFAHNYHTSLTRIDFNKKEKSLEIEINLFNHDLESVLVKRNAKRINLEKSKETDKLLFEYLKENFIVVDSSGNVKNPVWIGKEILNDMTTVFIEIGSIENLDGLKLQNKIFFESVAEQVNLVTIHSDIEKFDLEFKKGDDFKDFKMITQTMR